MRPCGLFALARVWLAAGLVVVSTASCERKVEFSGIGRWSVTKTTRGDAAKSGRCTPTDLPDGRKGSFCFGLSSPKIGGKTPEVHIYFGEDNDAAKPVEIQYQVHGCQEEAVETWLKTNFGDPIESRAKRGVWQTKHMVVIGMLPEAPGNCMVRLFPHREAAEIERVKKL